MTRIIAGSAGGRRLRTPPGDSTRPTSDRVREALFSALQAACGSMSGLRFLDLYAGSGAVGLEAMSRGVGFVTLVERDRSTAALIRANAETLGFAGVDVIASTVERALSRVPRAPYDLVFIDPPYSLPAEEFRQALTALVKQEWLAGGALVVVERSSRDDFVWPPDGFAGDRSRRYGETVLWYGRATGPAAMSPT